MSAGKDRTGVCTLGNNGNHQRKFRTKLYRKEINMNKVSKERTDGFLTWLKIFTICITLTFSVPTIAAQEESGAALYSPIKSYSTLQIEGAVELEPDHRRGPVQLVSEEPSTLPITVWIPEGATHTTPPLPVVIWSHGGGGQKTPRESSSGWSEAFASAGYVVLAMHHMVRPLEDVLKNICGHLLGVTESECSANGEKYKNAYESMDRPQDAIAVLDSLQEIGNIIGVTIDATRVAIAGHSGGTNSPIYLAGGERDVLFPSSPGEEFFFSATDSRPKAFIGMSPPGGTSAGWTSVSLDEIDRPFLSATGIADLNPGKRIELHDQLSYGDQYRMFLNSTVAGHDLFDLKPPSYLDDDPDKQLAGRELQELFQSWLISTAIAFVDAYVGDNNDALMWLRSGDMETIIEGVVPNHDDIPPWSMR